VGNARDRLRDLLGGLNEIHEPSGYGALGHIGFRKPDARIYAIAIRHLGLIPERILFVDDRLANVRGARAQGLQVVLFDAGAALGDEPACTFEALSGLLSG